MSPSNANGSLSGHLNQLAEGLGRLFSHHLQLAKLELSGDAQAIGAAVARLAVFIPFVVVGYAFLCAGVALLLLRLMPAYASALLVGGINVVGGGVGLYVASRKLKGREVMKETVSEFRASAAALAHARELPRLEGPDAR
ncbi:MAG: phage holin family protein [Myxococcota bacterium]